MQQKHKAIFIDRDGVINVYVDHLAKAGDFVLYETAAPAVKKINESPYLAIVITNQPMVSKGFITEAELDEIHAKMQAQLKLGGAHVDKVYYCPHHPEKGFKGEVPELKITCGCRKPKLGMIEQAVRDFNLVLGECCFIGDSSTDAKTAENARIPFFGVKTGYGMKDGFYPLEKPFVFCENLLDAVSHILKP